MIFSEAPGSVYRGQGTYSKIGYGLSVYQQDYWFSQPSVQLVKDAQTPYKEYTPLTVTEKYSWIGSAKDDQVEEGYGYYWDSETEDWVSLADGYGFVLRPMVFDNMFSGRDFVASYRLPAITTKRPRFRDVLGDTNNDLHICPVFWTDKGLALPDFSDEVTWRVPFSTSSSTGVTFYDFDLCVHTAPAPIVGLCVVGSMTSESVGGLINQRTESLATAYIGQTEGSFFLDVVGRPFNYLELSNALPAHRDDILAFLPWSGKTIKEVCSVKNINGEIRSRMGDFMAYFQNYNRYGNESHTSTSNTGSLSLRPTLSPSFSLPGITTPNLGVRPETLILVGGGILLLAYLSRGNKGLGDLGQSTTGAVTNVADAVGNTAGLVANVSDKANQGLNALFDLGYGIGRASVDGWSSVSKTLSGGTKSGNAVIKTASGGLPASLKTSVSAPVAASGLLINQSVKAAGSSVGSAVSSVVSSLSPVSVGLKTGAKVGTVVGSILTKK